MLGYTVPLMQPLPASFLVPLPPSCGDCGLRIRQGPSSERNTNSLKLACRLGPSDPACTDMMSPDSPEALRSETGLYSRFHIQSHWRLPRHTWRIPDPVL